MWRRVGLAVLDDPVVSWLGESMAASSGSTSPEPTCRLVASQSSQQGRRIWTNKDQPQGSGLRTRIRPTIRIRIEDQELDQADLNCRIEACDHLKGQFERSRRWLLPLWDDTGANGSQTKWPVICMEVRPELCKTVKGKQQRLKSCGDKVKMLLGKTQLLCSFGFPGGGRKIQRFYVANTL